ncbi:hypothetical protein [Paenibacillus agricola]|uniref:Uncharacterized protein n=1 Tax=Paenibacillus agricola TaxID=2716264 RepID=A0ABX0IZI2_9BACL|nr:hypothetical protein [Paenibacillus agricola]NHN28561.1 hypothetical protein [Paenibacillus agricola]
MKLPYSTMNEEELLKEYLLLSEVTESLEHLLIYNPKLQWAMEDVQLDIQQIMGQLFFRYQHHHKINLNNVIVSSIELQSRMKLYLRALDREVH